MRIALLVCDHVKPEFESTHGDYPYMFGQLLPDLVMDPWFVCDGEFPHADQYDAFIATGSKLSVYDPIDWITNLKAFTKHIYDSKKKFVGVCFGHQLIAEALGGKVEKAYTGYLIGVHKFDIQKEIPWLHDGKKTYNILMLCQDQVSKLPPEAMVYAGSETCPIGMFTVGKYFLGIQGHPEFSKSYNEVVFKSRPDRISEAKVGAAMQSFENDPDTQWLRDTIMSFLVS